VKLSMSAWVRAGELEEERMSRLSGMKTRVDENPMR
jgi:hypothetical protein